MSDWVTCVAMMSCIKLSVYSVCKKLYFDNNIAFLSLCWCSVKCSELVTYVCKPYSRPCND